MNKGSKCSSSLWSSLLLLYNLMGMKPSKDLKICDNVQLLYVAVAQVCGYRGHIQKSSGLRE